MSAQLRLLFSAALAVALVASASAAETLYIQQPNGSFLPLGPAAHRSLTELTLNDLGVIFAGNLLNIVTVCVGFYMVWGKVRAALIKALLDAVSEGKIVAADVQKQGLTPREQALVQATSRQILIDAGFQPTK